MLPEIALGDFILGDAVKIRGLPGRQIVAVIALRHDFRAPFKY